MSLFFNAAKVHIRTVLKENLAHPSSCKILILRSTNFSIRFTDFGPGDSDNEVTEACLTAVMYEGCNQKFPDWVDNEIYAYNNKHSFRSNTKGYGDKTH
jgi:hypothetical protein